MVDTKDKFHGRNLKSADISSTTERRRLSKVVHDHKGTARVEWHDAPDDHERQAFEIEGSRQPATPANRGLSAGSLAIKSEDSHNPYMRIPEAERKRTPGQRTDLRKLSAWIKMMRALEEAKKHKDEDD
jgi:hypothetical protein